MRQPRLRTVEKYRPPFPLNSLPSNFALSLGREVVYHLATRTAPILEGTDLEQGAGRKEKAAGQGYCAAACGCVVG